MNKKLLVLGVIVLGIVVLMMVKNNAGNGIKVVDMSYITKKINSNAIIVDVRSEAVYNGETPGRGIKGGHIKGAINLPISTLMSAKNEKVKLSLLETNGITKEKEIITYCNTGKQSQQFSEVLVKLGYKNIKNYKGGMKEWGSISANTVITN